jgi:hypothetical protein
MAKPALPLLPVDWFCFGMLKIYHIACYLATLTLGSNVRGDDNKAATA